MVKTEEEYRKLYGVDKDTEIFYFLRYPDYGMESNISLPDGDWEKIKKYHKIYTDFNECRNQCMMKMGELLIENDGWSYIQALNTDFKRDGMCEYYGYVKGKK